MILIRFFSSIIGHRNSQTGCILRYNGFENLSSDQGLQPGLETCDIMQYLECPWSNNVTKMEVRDIIVSYPHPLPAAILCENKMAAGSGSGYATRDTIARASESSPKTSLVENCLYPLFKGDPT